MRARCDYRGNADALAPAALYLAAGNQSPTDGGPTPLCGSNSADEMPKAPMPMTLFFKWSRKCRSGLDRGPAAYGRSTRPVAQRIAAKTDS